LAIFSELKQCGNNATIRTKMLQCVKGASLERFGGGECYLKARLDLVVNQRSTVPGSPYRASAQQAPTRKPPITSLGQ